MSTCAFDVRRQALISGAYTAVSPPSPATFVRIMNQTGASLKVWSDPNDPLAYFDLADGWEWEAELQATRARPSVTAFYLQAAQDGTAIIVWR